jgi:TRAP-type mannitol/chloroaromatic compound transport system substrate-binding protein
MSKVQQRRALLGAGLAAAIAAPAVGRAQEVRRWRMVTSWTKNLPGPGVSAERLAQRIAAMSDGRLLIDVFPAGQIVSAFGVFDAVAAGAAEMGHSASFFWDGKMTGAALFTTAPFGMGPLAHQSWIEHGGGQALWDELYRPLGVRAVLAGNTGPSLGGWFRSPINALKDISGLRIRASGLGGEVYAALGAAPLMMSPGETNVALERGTIDAVELLAPVNDLPVGLYQHAPYYYMPGFNKPNGASEALFSLRAFEALPKDLQAIVLHACAAEHSAGLSEAEAQNAQALTHLLAQGVQLLAFPDDVLVAARQAAVQILDQKAVGNALAGRIISSYRAAEGAGRSWSRLLTYMQQALQQS